MCGCRLGRRIRVSFLEDREGQPWTWVMGEHANDKSIEQILEEEAQETARQQAAFEAEQLRYIKYRVSENVDASCIAKVYSLSQMIVY